ncbi:hypothetical protein E2562_023262 [Oryza meyeriana var. granulata]|uniref:Uncharacterized protein n=1 Tax=Oryza meyeriana var. granulata TaxID=110450 RepID=A0A6G1DLZ9_9ORYZ|nr:hypothetical protein E2562_023262 [Oryza meyeriana var. granulata]
MGSPPRPLSSPATPYFTPLAKKLGLLGAWAALLVLTLVAHSLAGVSDGALPRHRSSSLSSSPPLTPLLRRRFPSRKFWILK